MHYSVFICGSSYHYYKKLRLTRDCQVHCKIYVKKKFKCNIDSIKIYQIIYKIEDNTDIFLKKMSICGLQYLAVRHPFKRSVFLMVHTYSIFNFFFFFFFFFFSLPILYVLSKCKPQLIVLSNWEPQIIVTQNVYTAFQSIVFQNISNNFLLTVPHFLRV